MALRWYATTPIHFDLVRAFNIGDHVPDSVVAAHPAETGGRVMQIDVPAQNPGSVLRPLLTSDRDSDSEKEEFVPSRLAPEALRAASRTLVLEMLEDGDIDTGVTPEVLTSATRAAPTGAEPLRNLVRAGAITAAHPLIPAGDSHTDNVTSAQYIWTRLKTVRNQPGEGLEDIPAAAIVPLGNNGMSLSVYLGGAGGANSLANLIAASPAATLSCWLTNDVRQGALGLTVDAIRAAGKTLLLQLIDALRAGLPDRVHALRVPAPFLTVNTGGSNYITDGTNINPVGLAQIYTDGVRLAHYDAVAARPGVLLYDPQTRLFGTISPTSTGLYYSNQIHQSQGGYEAEGDDFAAWVAAQAPFSAALAATAVAASPATPWTVYHRDVEDPARYALVGEYGLVNANPTSYVDLGSVASASGPPLPPVPGNIQPLDLLEFLGGRTTVQLPASGTTRGVSGANVRITGLSLTVTAAARTKVRVYRRVLGSDSVLNAVLADTSRRYKKTAFVSAGSTTVLDFTAISYASAVATQFAAEWAPQLVPGDQVYVEGGGAPLVIGTDATAAASGNQLRLTGLSGLVNWATYVGKQVVVVGNHA